VNAPTHCCEIARLVETGRVFSYSPASAGAPIKGFRNVGGWGSQALDYFLEYGLNETVDWPANAMTDATTRPRTSRRSWRTRHLNATCSTHGRNAGRASWLGFQRLTATTGGATRSLELVSLRARMISGYVIAGECHGVIRDSLFSQDRVSRPMIPWRLPRWWHCDEHKAKRNAAYRNSHQGTETTQGERHSSLTSLRARAVATSRRHREAFNEGRLETALKLIQRALVAECP